MYQKTKKKGRLAGRLAGLLLTVVLVTGTLSLAAWAADSYSSVAKGTVSWQMIYQNTGTYYWKDGNGAYCALTAEKSGSSYCVTLKTSGTGSKVCYLRQTKSSVANKIQKWSGASGVYTGGTLYKKASDSTGAGDSGSSSSGSGSGTSSGGSSSGTVAADGTYKANGTVSFSKDNYSFTLTLTVSGGKIASLSQTITTSTRESKSKSEYQPKAMSALSSALVGKAATTSAVDAVSSGTPKYSFAALKAAAREAIASAIGSSSGSGSGSEGGYTPVTESEIGKGVGEKTGTKYTGKGTIADEYITLDVYVSGGKITGLFIADEVGDWLNLLTQESANYIGRSAAVANVNAVSSATTLGFRNTIRDAVANAVAKADTGSGASSGTSAASYKVDGYDRKYSYSALNSGRYYYLYKGTYYQVKGLKYYSKDKGKNYYCGYFTMNGVRYYLDDKPQAYSSSELSDEHPGDDSSSKAYESCEKSKVSKGKNLPLYVAVN